MQTLHSYLAEAQLTDRLTAAATARAVRRASHQRRVKPIPSMGAASR